MTAPDGAAARAMFRYVIGLDGATVRLTGDPVAVAAFDDPAGIEFWAEHHDGLPEFHRTFTVIGTGQPIPHRARYVGTAPRTRHGLVWHLYELPGEGVL